MSAVTNTNTRKKKKRKSQAPVALVYFITVLIFMGLLATLSIYLLKEFNIINDKDGDDEVTTKTSFNNFYARVNSKGVLADCAFVRIEPDTGKILVVPISAMTVSAKEKSKTFRDVFETSGMTGLTSAVCETYGVTVDNYLSLTNDAFERVADIFGGITYTPEEELYYLSQENNENDISISKGELVNLSGRQIRLIFQYPLFASGKQGNIDFMGLALSRLINNAFQQANITIDNLDNIYSIITENSDTDLTSDDFNLQKSFVKEMLASGLSPAEQMIPRGTWSENDESFEVSSEFTTELKNRIEGTTETK